jgi:hypothetical protein
MTSEDPARMPAQQRQRNATLVVTNLTKIVGLVIAFNEALLRTDQRPLVLGVAAFAMTGAQLSETVVLAFIDRFLGREAGQER